MSLVVTPVDGNSASLLQAFYKLVEAEVGADYAAEVLGRLGRHLNHTLYRRGVAALSPQLVVAAVLAAHGSCWSSRDAVCLLVALQNELEATGEPALPYLQRVITLVREGGTIGEILTHEGELVVARATAH